MHHDRWNLFDTATPEERHTFVDLAATLAVTHEVAAPPNRFRNVLRLAAQIAGSQRVYYLKQFEHTQLKNRLRSRLTQPRCGLDGDREAGVAQALREAGFATARPIAVGAQPDGASYYLCAEVAGDTVQSLIRGGQWSCRDDARLAAWCGAILRAGIVLTDLSTEHVFVTGEDRRFSVIDLHNGRTGGRATQRELVRLMRRFAKSARGLGIPRTRAIRFALALLRGAGRSSSSRTILERLPPFDTHGRYDAGTRSARYRDRNPARTARELAMLARIWPGQGGDTVLDFPCGAGRLGDFIERDRSSTWFACDRSDAMLRELLVGRPTHPVALADAADMPFGTESVDGVVVFRFLHHLDDAAAQRVLDEATRVARRYVVVSWFHPVSAHNLRRVLGRWLRPGHARTRFTRSTATMRRWLRQRGFGNVTVIPEQRYRRDLWIAAAVREPG